MTERAILRMRKGHVLKGIGKFPLVESGKQKMGSRHISKVVFPPPAYAGLTAAGVRQAYQRIGGVVKKTPLELSHHLSSQFDMQIWLKKEHLSLTSSYKERGALNKMLVLSPEERQNGVICASAGNHAQAVSYHSTRLGIKGTIVMPENTPWVKIANTKKFGGSIVLHGDSFDDALDKASEIAAERKMTFINAFDDVDVVCGQGTVALEMLEQNPYLDAIVVPVGGGGLIAGMALALKEINPRIEIYGAESLAVPGMKESLKLGHVVKVPKRPSIADGIAVQRVGEIPFGVIKDRVEDIALVDEEEIARAIMLLLEQEKTLVEGAGATGVAALISGKLPQLKGKTVGVVLSGGNIDMAVLGRIIEKGLVQDGRICRIHVLLNDSPGNLARITTIISSTRANIRELTHERAFAKTVGVTQTVSAFSLDIRGRDHLAEIVDVLKKNNYEFSIS